MANETIKALLIVAPFGVLGSALYWLAMQAQSPALIPVRVVRGARRR
jgi:hypothetical protein